jgi:hypothetical protein
VLDPKIFKAYDVRGIYPTELDEEGARAIGRSYVEEFEPRRIAVGRDMRLSAPAMAAATIEGATTAGADVLDLGTVGTEMVYFAVGELALDGGIAVTASHNPKEYTGMKIVRRGALPVGGVGPAGDPRPGPFWTGPRDRPGTGPGPRPDVYISWYTDGIRVVDTSNPRAPVEVEHFVPPAGRRRIHPPTETCSPTRRRSGASRTTKASSTRAT